MSYSTPTTAVSGNVLTAAIWNASVRDNFAETCVAAVTTAGDITYADGANSMTRVAIGAANSHLVSTGSAPVWREISNDTRGTSNTASTTYTDLAAGAGPEVTITTGTKALVVISCHTENNTAGTRNMMGYAISGATTLAADDARAWGFQSQDANDPHIAGVTILQTGLTAGSNTFTAKYRTTLGSSTAVFQDRRLGVVAF